MSDVYTHFAKVSSANGYAVGVAGEEVNIVTPTGEIVGGVNATYIKLNKDTPGIGTGVLVKEVGAGGVILDVFARVTTKWAAASGDITLSVGYGDSLNEFVNAVDIKVDPGLLTKVSGVLPTAILSAATSIKAKVTGTPTGGAAEIMVLYIV